MIVEPDVDGFVDVIQALVAELSVEGSDAAGAGAGRLGLTFPRMLLDADLGPELELRWRAGSRRRFEVVVECVVVFHMGDGILVGLGGGVRGGIDHSAGRLPGE